MCGRDRRSASPNCSPANVTDGGLAMESTHPYGTSSYANSARFLLAKNTDGGFKMSEEEKADGEDAAADGDQSDRSDPRSTMRTFEITFGLGWVGAAISGHGPCESWVFGPGEGAQWWAYRSRGGL